MQFHKHLLGGIGLGQHCFYKSFLFEALHEVLGFFLIGCFQKFLAHSGEHFGLGAVERFHLFALFDVKEEGFVVGDKGVGYHAGICLANNGFVCFEHFTGGVAA